jgi:rubredoxin
MSEPHHDKNEPPEGFDDLVKAVKPLAAEIQRMQSQMKAAGLFANDRELLDCPHCKLEEDVTASGVLITCQPESPGIDTGLRFQSLDTREDWWRCPVCGTEFRGEGISE